MAHVQPRSIDEVPALKPIFDAAESAMGFVPNSMLTMAHMPQLPIGFMMLTNVVFGGDLKAMAEQLEPMIPEQGDVGDNLPPPLIQLIAYATSVSSGCRYCQAHTAHSGHRQGAEQEKFDSVLDHENSPAYSDAERAAIGLALAAGAVPNQAEAQHFERLRAHFSERQIVQIVAVIAIFGFLNRWNDTMATQLEPPAVGYATASLAELGWACGKHG
ncbi:MAG: carboxymuconolactone decarboxylase family protein [Pseudomonadales bacterium]|nr:carboxymuconolactone decarboxylase family protein [Pseudomonadales bacterium]NIX08400.1 carboxymuconolactone decarboxylase family protein [Pseudomonadales bacterium]